MQKYSLNIQWLYKRVSLQRFAMLLAWTTQNSFLINALLKVRNPDAIYTWNSGPEIPTDSDTIHTPWTYGWYASCNIVYVRLTEVRNSTSLLTRNKVIFLWTIKAKTLFLKVVVNWDAGTQKDQWPFVEGSTRSPHTHGYILNMQSFNVFSFQFLDQIN